MMHEMRRSDRLSMVIVNPGNVNSMQAVEAPGYLLDVIPVQT